MQARLGEACRTALEVTAATLLGRKQDSMLARPSIYAVVGACAACILSVVYEEIHEAHT